MTQRYWALPTHRSNPSRQLSLLNAFKAPVSFREGKRNTEKPFGSHQSRRRQTGACSPWMWLCPGWYWLNWSGKSRCCPHQALPFTAALCGAVLSGPHSLYLYTYISIYIYTYTPKGTQKCLVCPSLGAGIWPNQGPVEGLGRFALASTPPQGCNRLYHCKFNFSILTTSLPGQESSSAQHRARPQ